MKKFLLIGGGVILLLAIIGASSGSKTAPTVEKKTETTTPTSQPTTAESTTPVTQNTMAPKASYEVLARKDAGNVENISVLVKVSADGEAAAREVKKTCKKQCNVDVYDDKKAYDLNAQYDTMMGKSTTQPSDLTAWKEKNYVFVGDHYVGAIMFEDDGYNDYPFRDWYYKELKGN